MEVDFVVFIVPDGATAVAGVPGNGNLAMVTRFLAVGTLDQLGMARSASPVALDTSA